MKQAVLLLSMFLFSLSNAQAQGKKGPLFSRADTLKGWNASPRSCYNVRHYFLDFEVHMNRKFIEGTNTMEFVMVENAKVLQIDLGQGMGLINVDWNGKKVPVKREEGAYFLYFPDTLYESTRHTIKLKFAGHPAMAKDAPWDGGFVWENDANGNPWVGVANQKEGASLWWPCKDQWLDEPDSITVRITVPTGLTAVSNGRLRKQDAINGKSRFEWFVSKPINHYNVTLYIGKFAHFSDIYPGAGRPLDLDYYVLEYNERKAKKHFEQVKGMFSCYDQFLGPYPFYEDGYKLVEAPYLGMEHQSAIAYGNDYLIGYAGYDATELGLEFDFIIIHETAHEYWGNSVSGADPADMWIHEAFATYMEAMYVECKYGKDIAYEYIDTWRGRIKNDKPMMGKRGLNDHPSTDVYYKGAFMLHTLRNLIQDEPKWIGLLQAIQTEFKHQTVTTEEFVDFIGKYLHQDYSWFFYQYLKISGVPVFVYSYDNDAAGGPVVRFRWENVMKDFKMPVFVNVNSEGWKKLEPTAEWKEYKPEVRKVDYLDLDEFSGYFVIRNASSKY